MTRCVLGIDPSVRSTGVCFLRDSESHTLTTLAPKGITGIPRLLYLRKALQDAIHRYASPDSIIMAVVEGYGYGPSQGHLATIIEWGGLVRVVLADMGVSVVAVPPATLKMFVTGRGDAKKNTMLMHGLKRWGLEFANDDECDAYSLAAYGLALHSEEAYTTAGFAPLTEAQEKALKKADRLYSPPEPEPVKPRLIKRGFIRR